MPSDRFLHNDQPEQARSGDFTPVDDEPMFVKAEPGVQVVERYRFGGRGTIVAVWKSWAWVMWDEYPPEHEPSTHHLTSLARAKPLAVENVGG